VKTPNKLQAQIGEYTADLDFVSYRKTFVRSEIIANKCIFYRFYLRSTCRRNSEYINKTKNQKNISINDIKDISTIINKFCKYAVIRQMAISPVRDIKDLYLLSLADTVQANYIITGDKDLLTLKIHNQTKIVTYNDFIAIIN
jgi:putative PIN family toxin of toxin-antitoxin system